MRYDKKEVQCERTIVIFIPVNVFSEVFDGVEFPLLVKKEKNKVKSKKNLHNENISQAQQIILI